MANYNDFQDTVAALEGGFQNKASDPGNFNSRGENVGTNFGISAPVYEKWIGRVPTIYDMKAITKTVAEEIFKTNYWNRLSASFIKNQSIAENLVDHGINAGVGTAAKIMQRVLNESFGKNLRIDGAIGPITLAAINNVNPVELFQKYSQARIEYYKNIGNRDWLAIWKRRVQSIANKFGIDIKKKVVATSSVLVTLSLIGLAIFLVKKNKTKK